MMKERLEKLYDRLAEDLHPDGKSKGKDTLDKWFRGQFDLPCLDFNLIASVLNEHLPARDRVPLCGVKGTSL